ncbi:hypothetical protein [Kineococcus indalonis]|nr:hypothetical protein [Kineococcus indalonis]NAZ85722.1 hypothetical protein [Kineococcus indalonis]
MVTDAGRRLRAGMQAALEELHPGGGAVDDAVEQLAVLACACVRFQQVH